jgi:hypothetical protein
MGIARSQLGRGPAVVTWNGITMWTRDDIIPRHGPVWNPVPTSLYGQIDKTRKDLVIKVPLRLWGAWESLSTLFPSAIMNPTPGTALFGASDLPLVILGRNGDQVTYTNAALTKLADLYLGVDEDLFVADVEFTALLANSANPEDDYAFYRVQTGISYADGSFAKTNFKKVRFSGAWGAKTGFTTIVGQKGWRVAWSLDAQPDPVDGLGTVSMFIGPNGLIGNVKCVPIGPTLAQIETQAKLGGVTGVGQAHGALLGANAADLTLAGSGISIVAKNAAIVEHGYAFGTNPLRVGEMAWETTRAFSAGVPAAVATVG